MCCIRNCPRSLVSCGPLLGLRRWLVLFTRFQLLKECMETIQGKFISREEAQAYDCTPHLSDIIMFTWCMLQWILKFIFPDITIELVRVINLGRIVTNWIDIYSPCWIWCIPTVPVVVGASDSAVVPHKFLACWRRVELRCGEVTSHGPGARDSSTGFETWCIGLGGIGSYTSYSCSLPVSCSCISWD